jgi:hypothetical protein
MTDDEMYMIINAFASQHPYAEGLDVYVSSNGKSFKTLDFSVGGKYEYSHVLAVG